MSRALKFRVIHNSTGKPVCAYQLGLTLVPDTGQIYQGGMNVSHAYTLVQFTGLTDKNGVDIYEDDLIKNMTGRTGRVVWHEPTAGFDSMFVSDSGDHDHLKRHVGFDTARWNIYVEVIGNIHENKELLAQGG